MDHRRKRKPRYDSSGQTATRWDEDDWEDAATVTREQFSTRRNPDLLPVIVGRLIAPPMGQNERTIPRISIPAPPAPVVQENDPMDDISMEILWTDPVFCDYPVNAPTLVENPIFPGTAEIAKPSPLPFPTMDWAWEATEDLVTRQMRKFKPRMKRRARRS